MNDAHLHLVVNHFPIIFPIVGVILVVIGLIVKSEPVKRTGYLIFILGSLFSIIAMTTGEGAEEVVEKIAGISESFIEEHEESAETFSILSYILGGISLLGLWASFTKKSFANSIAVFTLVFAIVTLYFAQITGTTGGEIRHTEIREAAFENAPTKVNKETNDDGD